MTFVEELAVVATETTVVKKAITKSLARTQATAAKKKPAKKAAKKPKAKKAKKDKKPKAKKKKKKKTKKVRYPGGKRAKGQWKSKAKIAGGKKAAAKAKAKGTGIYKKCTCSADLAAITGSKSMTRGQAVKAVWAFIKKNQLNKGRNVKAVGKIFGGGSMFKLA